MMYFVEKLIAVASYQLTLQFNTGETRVADLEPTLRAKAASPGSAYGKLLDPEVFSRARLDPESRTICWDGLAREIAADGTEQPAPLDLCPDVLYQLSTPVAQGALGFVAEEEHKRAEAAGLALKEEPPRKPWGN